SGLDGDDDGVVGRDERRAIVDNHVGGLMLRVQVYWGRPAYLLQRSGRNGRESGMLGIVGVTLPAQQRGLCRSVQRARDAENGSDACLDALRSGESVMAVNGLTIQQEKTARWHKRSELLGRCWR